jgi:dTDP-glucose pyrophosphorylase/predicted transcriptional regulator
MKDWRATLVSAGTSLEKAIAIMDKSALRVALVVDDEARLLGTLTDGDVRRALLQHTSMEVDTGEIMNKCPQTARPDWSHERVMSVLESAELLQLPVVDDDGRVVGLHTLHGLLEQKQLDNPVFIMAGGFGTRLHPLTHDCPKPLLKLGDTPILGLILERLIDAGFHRFFISTHYLPEMIREHFGDGTRWGVSIRYTHEETPLGTGGAVGLLPHDEINEPMLMLNGDLLTTLNYRELIHFHNDNQGVATICVCTYEHEVPYGVVESEGHLLRAMVEKPVHKYFVNAGIYLLEPELVKSVQPGTKIDMPTLLERWIEAGLRVTTFPVHEYWLDIGRMVDFKQAQKEIDSL